MRQGPRNTITDVAGLRVGQAHDAALRSGVTVLTADAPFSAGVHVMGGAPGTRETDLLAPDRLVQQVDALVLSGGSAFGLDAASGVADALRRAGRGFAVGNQVVPIVPAAILFDLGNGGDKAWRDNPYRALGAQAFEGALSGATSGAASGAGQSVTLGSVGAGYGAATADLKGGLGSASCVLPGGATVGALVAVNALGSACVPGTRHFWAAPFELEAEFGGLGPAPATPLPFPPRLKGGPRDARGQATTIAIIATDVALSQAQCTRLAIAAHDGMARALVPSHTPFDGDLVFAAATGARPLEGGDASLLLLGHAAACCLSRAIARGVYEASAMAGDQMPSWQTLG